MQFGEPRTFLYWFQGDYSKLSWHKVLPDQNIGVSPASVEGHWQMG
jgi:hypothetical protein